jgi:hypothetical protein
MKPVAGALLHKCVVCGLDSNNSGKVAGQHLCYKHWEEVYDPELVDDLAREIYVKEWLIPQKKKNGS